MNGNDNESFPAPAIGVGGIVFNDKSEVLLIRRNKEPALGQWSIPGGCLEPGETLVDSCKREIREETGMDVKVKNIVAVVERRLENFHYIIIDFFAELEPGSACVPVAQSDVSEAKWVSMEELKNLHVVEGLEEIIHRACRDTGEGKLSGLVDIESAGTDFIVPF